ncbi:MAG: class I SAM-dependent methyltransferase [Bacteroidota bacterium]
MASARPTSQPDFWNARYQLEGYAFGARPDPFVARALVQMETDGTLAVPSRVADLGAGEGRLAVFAAERGHQVVAVDFAADGLHKARGLARERGVTIHTAVADIQTWKPAQPLDGILLGLVHLLPAERHRLLKRLPELLRPGGVLIARWFDEAHAARGTFGPSKPDRLVTARALHNLLPSGTMLECTARTVAMDQGRYLRGVADVVDVVWQSAAVRQKGRGC